MTLIECCVFACRAKVIWACLIPMVFVLNTHCAGSTKQDIVGIYFDQAGETATHSTTGPLSYVEAWLILKNISAEAGLRAIVMRGEVVGPAYNYCWNSLIGESISYCYPDWPLPANPPIPQMDLIVAVHMWAWVVDTNDRIEFYIKPALGVPPYDGESAVYHANDGDPGTIVPLTPSSGSYDKPVAVINGEVAVSNGKTWGCIKALFR